MISYLQNIKKNTSFSIDMAIDVNGSMPTYNTAFTGFASDSDGSNLIGCTATLVYISIDSGTTWKSVLPSGSINDNNWKSVASDADGSNLVVGSSDGRLYTSADGGTTWTERQPTGDVDKNWVEVASDSDGSNLIAVVSGGRVYTSDDSGVTWTERQPGGDADLAWTSVASDADGSNLIASVTGGRLYTSSNAGVAWTERQPGGNTDLAWSSVASGSDGSDLFVSVNGGRVYTSDNSGVTWNERQPNGDADKTWTSVAISADGTKLITIQSAYYKTYNSVNSGVDWAVGSPANTINKTIVEMSSDGLLVFVRDTQQIRKSSVGGGSWSSLEIGKWGFLLYKDDVLSKTLAPAVAFVSNILQISLTAEEMNADKISIAHFLNNSTILNQIIISTGVAPTPQEVWEYVDRAITGGGTTVQSPAVMTSIAKAVNKGYIVSRIATGESGYNYYGLTNVKSPWWLIIQEKTDFSNVGYKMAKENRLSFNSSWTNRATLNYGEQFPLK